MKGLNWENINDGLSHVIISNHRDIVLDAAFEHTSLFARNGYYRNCHWRQFAYISLDHSFGTA